MSNSNQSSVTLVPAQQGTFLEMWAEIVDVPKLYIAVGEAEDGNGKEIGGEILLVFDHVFWQLNNGMKCGMVYTDHRLFKDSTNYGLYDTRPLLERAFHSQQFHGVAFNTPTELTVEVPYHTTATTAGLARIIGLLESEDPMGIVGSHVFLAEKALKEDRVYAAYHHAAAARESGAPLDEFYFTELDAMITLGLHHHVGDFLNWYLSNGGADPRFELYRARAHAMSGDTQTAFQIVETSLSLPELSQMAYLEKGRAHVISGDNRKAVEAFEQSLQMNPQDVDTLMGYAIALRNIAFHEEDLMGLDKAVEALEKIVRQDGYHVPEALHHLATINVVQERWPEAERFCRETLERRESGVARRNLCLSLHAQGRLEEAQKEYYYLARVNPPEAEHVKHLFQ